MMKNFTQTLTTAFIVVLLFSFGLVNAQTVHFDDDEAPTKATSITGLILNDVTYDISFVMAQEAGTVYGDYSDPTFTFTDIAAASEANVAMIAVLQSFGATDIGVVDGEIGGQAFQIGYSAKLILTVENVDWEGGKNPDGLEWKQSLATEPSIWIGDPKNWAIFTEAGSTRVNDALLGGVSISVFPNPAKNYIHIKAEASIKSIDMSDITGKVMQRLYFEVGESTTLDVSEFNGGVYFLKLEDDKGHVIAKKVIIQ
jgi:hypothetical protein